MVASSPAPCKDQDEKHSVLGGTYIVPDRFQVVLRVFGVEVSICIKLIIYNLIWAWQETYFLRGEGGDRELVSGGIEDKEEGLVTTMWGTESGRKLFVYRRLHFTEGEFEGGRCCFVVPSLGTSDGVNHPVTLQALLKVFQAEDGVRKLVHFAEVGLNKGPEPR